MNKTIHIEVIYALPEKQTCISLDVDTLDNVENAIKKSGILQKFPEIDLQKNQVGIFSQKAKLTDKLHEGDRIEIYRPLTANPREIRRRRAQR